MKLRSQLSDQEIEKGFDGSEDLFAHRDLGVRLTSLYESLEHGTVALFDGRWGIGKTTFARRWVAHLKQANIPAIYFDAFASDYIERPFEAVAGAFVKAAAEAGRAGSPAYNNFLDRAARVGKVVAGAAAKIGVKAATLGLIGASDIEQFDGVKDDIADALSGASEASVKKLLEGHDEREADFAALREALTQLPGLLQPNQESVSEPTSRPLVVVIDELDRCRPDFALGIVETLKHFFRVDGIHFLLVTNRDHLALSVAHRYGTGLAAAEYLEKFYDFVIHFEQNYSRHEPGNVSTFINHVAQKLLSFGTEGMRDIPEYVGHAARAFNLSLRQIEAVFTNIALAYVAAREREFRPAVLITFLALIKTKRPDLYRKAKAGTLQSHDFAEFVSGKDWQDFNIDRIILVFRYHLETDLNESDEQWRGYGSSLFEYNLERTRVIPFLTNNVLDRFGRGQAQG